MARALRLARRGEGRVEPNPMVGCVVTRGDKIVGEGFHRRFGGPHAEVHALRSCRGSVRGATTYLSLEPCSHQGKTPPCADALIEAGISRVVIPFPDPNPIVRGRGVARLRRAGIRVEIGLLATQAAELIAPFATRILRGRPYVIAKWAQTLDGKWAARTGDSHWISCAASRRWVHRLRARVDAILVGANTVRRDDPLLTAREVPIRRRAARVVMDARLTVSEKCRLIETVKEAPLVVLTSRKQAGSIKAHRLEDREVTVLSCRAGRGLIAAGDALRTLADRDCTTVLLEGGPTLTASFLAAGLIDEAYVFIASRVIGDRQAPALLRTGPIRRIHNAPAAVLVNVTRMDQDLCVRLRWNNPPWPE